MFLEMVHDTVNDHTSEKSWGPNKERQFTRTSIRLKLGDKTLLHESIIVDRSVHTDEEAYRQAALDQGADQIRSWFERVDRMMEKLESL